MVLYKNSGVNEVIKINLVRSINTSAKCRGISLKTTNANLM